MQRWTEFRVALDVLRPLEFESVLEIGSGFGGTLMAWSDISGFDCKLMSIDEDHSQLAPDLRERLRPGHELELWESRSDDPLALVAAREFFGGQIDFLFIDADHSYEAAKQDFETYSPLVRKGGWIGLHDVSGPHACATFWSEIREDYRQRVEIALEEEHPCGIGLVRVPE